MKLSIATSTIWLSLPVGILLVAFCGAADVNAQASGNWLINQAKKKFDTNKDGVLQVIRECTSLGSLPCGRPPVIDDTKATMACSMHQDKDKDLSVKEICSTLSISKTTVERYLQTEDAA